MGIEYVVRLASQPFQLRERIRRLIVDSDALELLRESPTAFEVRFLRGGARRTSWPEDVLISLEDPGVYILFHSSTRDEEEQFLSALSATLKEAGVEFSIEEL